MKPVPAWVVAPVAAACLLSGGAAGFVAGVLAANLPAVSPPSAPAKTVRRDQLLPMIQGKTPDEVIKILGKPADTMGANPAEAGWVYHRLTTDPVTGNTDYSTCVWFRDGVADHVN